MPADLKIPKFVRMVRSVDILETPIEYLKGVGPARAEVLRSELRIHSFNDLLQYFPFRYVDRSKFYSIAEIRDDYTYIQLRGTLVNVQKLGKPRSMRLVALLKDESGLIELVWFKGVKWMEQKLTPGTEYVVFGKPNYFNGRYNIPHPEIETVAEQTATIEEKLQPFYSSTEKLKAKGLDSKGIRKIVKNLLVQVQGHIREVLSEELINNLRLLPREEAMISIHFPREPAILERARARLKFEELFFIQLNLLKLKLLRIEKTTGHRFSEVGDHFNTFYHDFLPFQLTNAQKRVIREIRRDIGSGKQMNRLLQGDVGSGKTLVALMSALIAIDNGFQACLMAPTEILANQHFKTITRMTSGLGLETGLLTGSTKSPQRKLLHEKLLSGELKLLVGTHALIEESVRFRNLGFVVIDEQHRFGVAQRARMWKKNSVPPHVLVMTATPIPRTLAMTFYGDLDVSVIDELPPGRKPVKTAHYFDKDRLKLFGFMKKMIAEGRQVYVVYPLINESEKLDLKDLQDGYDSISRAFPLPHFAISIVHGKMKTKDKDYEMDRFVRGETDIMVSTTVIEVGVDVPNASVMVIENAERFGLSQLHQLRGRVGRGADQSYCMLMTKTELTADARKRVQTMVRTSDGFEIAEADLKLRGPGDLHGTQQSGILDLKISDIVKDEKILKYARSEAVRILEKDPHLELKENRRMADHLKQINRSKTNWSLIS
jgi:ATP-dependent DNA helicase RecG